MRNWMTAFKPNKKKAMIDAAKQEAVNTVDHIVGAMAKEYPEAAGILGLLKATYGTRLAYKQAQLNQFIERLMEHPEIFTEEIIADESFLDGLVVQIDTYFKLRTDEKKRLAEEIFFDFGKSSEKPLYPLERYNDVLSKISESGIRFLGFAYTHLPKLREIAGEQQYRQNGNTEPTMPKSEWVKIYGERKPLSEFIEARVQALTKLTIEQNAGNGKLPDIRDVEKTIRHNLGLVAAELEHLGIITTFSDGALSWSQNGSPAYNLTDFGNKFASVIKPVDIPTDMHKTEW